MRLYVRPETLLMQYLAEYLTHFITFQRRTVGQRLTHPIGIKKSRSRWNKVRWKQHFLGLLARCLEKYYGSQIFPNLHK